MAKGYNPQARVIGALNGTTRRFSPSHPFWREAVELRVAFGRYGDIAARARVLGYPELTERVIKDGLTWAPGVLGLPARTTNYLRQRYKEAITDFDARETLQLLVIDAIDQLNATDEALSDDELSVAKRADLDKRRDVLVKRIKSWSSDLVDIGIRLEDIKTDRVAVAAGARNGPSSVKEWIEELVPNFHQLTAPPPPDELIAEYGADNLRFPTRRPAVVDVEQPVDDDAEGE